MNSGTPATSLQRTFILASLRGGSPPPYHVQPIFELNSECDPRILREAFARVVARHPALRSQFRFEGARILQYRDEALSFDWTEHAEDTSTDEVIAADFARPFAFGSTSPLWRVSIVRIRGGGSLFVLTVHHAIFDWFARGLVIEHLFAEYDNIVAGRPRGADGRDFVEFAEWQASRDWSVHEGFWRERLSRHPEPTTFAPVHGGARKSEHGPARVSVAIDAELEAGLRALAKAEDVTMNTLLQAAWALWLARSLDAPRVIFGGMRGCRKGSCPGADEIVGPLLNTVPVCAELPEDIRVGEWLRGLRAEWVALREVESCPLEHVAEWAGFPPGVPMFESAVNFQRTMPQLEASKGSLGARGRLVAVRQDTDLPILIAGYDLPTLSAELVYRRERVDAAYAELAASCLPNVMRNLVRGAAGPLSAITLLSEDETQRIFAFGAGPKIPVERMPTQILSDAARAHSTRPAMERCGRTWTYAELDAITDRIARELISRGAQREGVIGIVVHASPQIAMSMFGVMKSGAAFFCLNPELPATRRGELLRAANVSTVVVGPGVDGAMDAGAPIVSLDELMAGNAEADLPSEFAPDALAYIVHTSGSTGEPKFIQIENKSFANALDGLISCYGLNPNDRRIQRAQPGSDYFVAEITTNLGVGACIVFLETSRPLGISEYLRAFDEHRITTTGIPASYWQEWVQLLREEGAARVPKTLRALITGMERVDPDSFRKWHEIAGDRVHWINVYGPSETTIVSVLYPIGAELPDAEQVPIGRSIENTQCYVLDRQMRPLPVGLAGELFIAGLGVMRGYRGRAAGDEIVPNPHSSDANYARLYRTGDFCHFLPDGNLAFIGRQDQQVKVRGHRIELGTVEAALSEVSGGCKTIALVNTRVSPPALWAVVESDPPLDESDLKARVTQRVGMHMAPSRILFMPELPRVPNGKLDRRRIKDSLPSEDDEAAEEVSAPMSSDDPEAIVLAVLRRVLKRGDLGAEDDFFAFGGDSLGAVRALGEIERLTGLQPPLRDLYVAKTARGLAKLIADGSRKGVVHIEAADGNADASARHHALAIPPAPGTHRNLRLLAKYWSGDAKLWMMEQEPPDLDAVAFPIAHLAANYAREIAARFAGREVTLIGYSSGGLVAWETARLLAGTQVGVRDVILLEPPAWVHAEDGSVTEVASDAHRGAVEKLARHLQSAGKLPLTSGAEYLREIAARKFRFIMRNVNKTVGDPSRFKALDEYNLAVSRAFDPGPLEARVRLLRGWDRSSTDSSEGYDGYWTSRGRDVRVHEVDGDHGQMLSEPEVRITAAVIGRILREGSA